MDKVDTFQAVIKLLPVVAPKFAALLMVKLVFTIPAVILGCLGFCWGWSLYERLQAGYAYVSEPGFRTQTVQAQPQMAQAPAAQLQPSAPVLQVPVPGIVTAVPTTNTLSAPPTVVQATTPTL
jgi:hypothetical protein